MEGAAIRRRSFLKLAGGVAVGLPWLGPILRAADAEQSTGKWPALAVFPQKRELILQADRPPNLETPLKYFRDDLTSNDVFYVRWHLATIPTRVDVNRFRLTVAGEVEQPLSLSLDELKRDFDTTSIVAVNQCSGNSRSLFDPRVPGVQWGNGAIGNAKWTGVPLRQLLQKAKLKAGAVEVSFNGLDEPTLKSAANFAGTPDFVKSLSVDHANDSEVMVAYAMNDQPLPMLNGFPLRLIVPGWFGTYWVKALSEITVLNKPFDGFWMSKAYRVPNTPGLNESSTALAKETVPISRMPTRSLFVRPEPDEKIPAGAEYEAEGVALDGGSGISKVEVSADEGKSWSNAKLGADLGKYSWRRWRFAWRPEPGEHRLMVGATSVAGETQVEKIWNRSGYARNVIESVRVVVG